MLCEGFASSEIVQVKSSSTYNCLRCIGAVAGLDSVKKHNVARLELLREKQKIVEKEFKLLRDECLRLKSLIEEMVGPTEKNLLKVLDDIKVVRQAYHGNVFVGNHCKIILRNFVMLCDVISRKAPEVCKDFKKVFGIFSEAHHYMAIKQLLSDSDIESLCYFCEEFGRVYPMVFPESPCHTRKMHELIIHVPTFANKHETVGFYNEEEGEYMHKVVNQQSRQVCSVRNPAERNLLIHKNMELSSNTNRVALETRIRKCRNCATFIKCGNCSCNLK